MNNNEAKFILSAYRPGGRDAGDPGMATALAQAKSDPVLGAWFARERAHDAAVAWKLRAVVPPVGLRGRRRQWGAARGRAPAARAETRAARPGARARCPHKSQAGTT